MYSDAGERAVIVHHVGAQLEQLKFCEGHRGEGAGLVQLVWPLLAPLRKCSVIQKNFILMFSVRPVGVC